MVARSSLPRQDFEDYLATLTEAVYRVILRQGLKTPFVDVQLQIWQALRGVVRQELSEVGDAEATVDPCKSRKRTSGHLAAAVARQLAEVG